MNPAVRHAVVFDLDHTVARVDTYPLFLLELLRRRPTRWLLSGLLPFSLVLARLGLRDNQWLKERALTVIAGGADPGLIERCSQQTADSVVQEEVAAGAIGALDEHRAAGCRLVLATASFDFYAQRIGELLGFHDVVCTLAERDATHRLTGRIAGKNCYGVEKVRRVAEVIEGRRENWHVTAYTDHRVDLPLLEWADSPKVVNPNGEMRMISRERGYPILDW